MPKKLTEIETLNAYLNGVMGRADHHAHKVREIALALVGAIIWKKDNGESISVMTQNNETKNVLWVTINKKRYAFSYNHEIGKIEMKEGTVRGKIIYSFDNDTELSLIRDKFNNL